jgi:hypothetical protein
MGWPTYLHQLNDITMKNLAVLSDDKAEVLSGGFLNTTFNQYGQTGGNASGSGSANLFRNSASVGQGLLIGIGTLGVRV